MTGTDHTPQWTRRAVLGGGMAAFGVAALPGWAGAAASGPADGGTAATFGPASLTAAIVGMTYHDGYAYVVTRGLVPAQLVEVHVATRKVTRAVSLPVAGIGSGEGAWAMTVRGGRIYAGMYPDARVHWFDPASGEVGTVGRCGSGNTFVWSLATAPDGQIFAGTYHDGGLWQVDPDTNTCTKIGSPVPACQYNRFVGVAGDRWVYAGVYQPATLIRYDRETATFADITPAALRGGAWGPFVTTDQHLYTIGGGRLVRMNLDGSDAVWVSPPPGDSMDALTVDGSGTVYGTGGRSGALYRWVPGQDLEQVAVPSVNADHRHLMMVDDHTMIGGIAWGGLFRYDTDTGTVDIIDLLEAGFQAGPEPPQSIAAEAGTLYFGGHWGLQVHDTKTWDTYRIPVPGELKTIDAIDGTVYSALYTSTNLVRIDPRARSVTIVGAIGNAQQRPWQSAYHQASGTLLIASAGGTGRLMGALTLWNIHTNAIEVFPNILPDQSVMSVVLVGDIAYIAGDVKGGGNVTPIRTSAAIGAFDVVQRKLLWMDEPFEGAKSIQSVAVLDEKLYGLYKDPRGRWFSYDLPSHTVQEGGTLASYGRINVSRGRVYASTFEGGQVYRIGPGLRTAKWLWTNLGNHWYTIPQVTPVPDDPTPDQRNVWTLKDFDIARISLAE